MEFSVAEIVIGIVTVILAFYYWATYTFNHWKKRNIAGPRPIPLLGNFAPFFLGRKSLAELEQSMYNEFKDESCFGFFNARMPVLMVTDPDLIRNVLIKDFDVFAGRGVNPNEKDDPLSANLFNLDGHRWKVTRAKLTPAFTTGKLKNMVTLIVECSGHFEKYMLNKIQDGKVVECRELAAKYTTDVIGSCAFGINMNALEREDSEFRTVGRKVFEPSVSTMMLRFLRDFSPKLFRLFGVSLTPKAYTDFFIKTIRDNMMLRDSNNIVRNDLVDLLRDMKKHQGEIDFELSESFLTAQAFVFFLAGFETSSTTIAFALYELALSPDVQGKLRSEILSTLKKHNGQLTYEIINEMKYLNMVVQETLRKHPPGVLLRRKSVKPYTIPGKNSTVPEGTIIHIPVYAIHHDERHYPEPEKFDPERFSEHAEKKRHPMVFLPFGDGPKNCIGARFALYQSKLGIISVIKHFNVSRSKLTDVPYKISKTALVLSPTNGIKLVFDRVNNDI